MMRTVSRPEVDGLRPVGLGQSFYEKNGWPAEPDRHQWCLPVGLRVIGVTAESAGHQIKVDNGASGEKLTLF